MAELKFLTGGAIQKPTPMWAKWAFRIFFYVTGITTIALDIFTEIPVDIKLKINSGVIKANLFVHLVSKMFGVDLSIYEIRQQATEKIQEKKVEMAKAGKDDDDPKIVT